ncbi:MAG: glycosyltransferase family 4 protein, partial [Chloroflexi bacterium]|nr:glycosyltransferase family 4 protein [Chloroflexota bacterium]
MKILHVVQRYWPCGGGAERYFQELSERLVRDGHDVTVYTTDAFDLELFWRPNYRRIDRREDVHNGVRIRRFPVHHIPFHLPLTLGLSLVPLRKVDLLYHHPSPLIPEFLQAPADGFDVVHATALPYNSVMYAGYLLAKRNHARFVTTPHVHLGEPGSKRMVAGYARRPQMWLTAQSDAIVAKTGIEADFMARRGVPRNRIHAIGNGVNPQELEGGDGHRFRTRYAIGADEPIVFYIGMKAFNKGTEHVVEAMRLLWSRGLRARLVLAGASQPPFRRFWQRQPPEVRQHTLMLDYIPDADKNDLLAAGDIFAMPSRSDTFGIVYLEAWYYAKPVIGAYAGGVPEVIREGQDGFLVGFGDTEALAARIAELVNNPELRRAFGQQGAAKVRQSFTWDAVYHELASLYSAG